MAGEGKYRSTKEARYQDIIAFIQALQSENHNPKFINRVILAVRHYYHHLGVSKNPASGIYIRGISKQVPIDIVPYEEVTQLYHQYQGLDNRTKRNKVMLGLLIYQGVTPEELEQLEPHHIQLKEAKIYLPATKRSLARVLPIDATQLLELQEYLLVIRQELQEDVEHSKLYRRPKQIDWEAVHTQLFFTVTGIGYLKNTLYHLFKHVKMINPNITSARVIRQSLITEWTKTIGIRQVQYMAGYRSVGTVERYRNYNLEELSEALNEFHPLQ